MNLILLTREDFIGNGQLARLTGRRLRHVLTVHRAQRGDTLRVGLINGKMGNGKIIHMDANALDLQVELFEPPPLPLDLNLILALPRPKMLRRILVASSSMGVKRIVLMNSYRVEKSFWRSPVLQRDKLNEYLKLGLEQAMDTLLPEIDLKPKFKPFVEDELADMIQGTRALVAHPSASESCPRNPGIPVTLAVGPEGGFIPYEVDKLKQCGFLPVHMGRRILRVETAVTTLIARLS